MICRPSSEGGSDERCGRADAGRGVRAAPRDAERERPVAVTLAATAVALRTVVAVVLAVAFADKSWSRSARRGLAGQLAESGLPLVLARGAIMVFLIVEATTVLLLTLPGTAVPGAAVASLLLAVLAVGAALLVRGDAGVRCARVDPRGSRLALRHVWRNAVLTALALGALAAARASASAPPPTLPVLVASVASGLAVAPVFLLWDDLAVALRPRRDPSSEPDPPRFAPAVRPATRVRLHEGRDPHAAPGPRGGLHRAPGSLRTHQVAPAEPALPGTASGDDPTAVRR